MSTIVLQTEKLSKWYGTILGISDIQLQIGTGIKGLLGPNGAGKSTLMKLATGQLKPSIGRITVFGEDVFGNQNLFRRIGFAPEYDSCYMEMSGLGFVSFMARLHGLERSAAAEKAAAAMEMVGLSESGGRRVKTYSFGMRQRLRIAAAMVHEPELLMLDEPLRGVDPLWRIRIIRLIKEYEKAGRTVIVSSHILPEIEAMTNDIILIHQGKVFAEGNIQLIRDMIDRHPHQVFIRSADPRAVAREFLDCSFVQGMEFDAAGDGLTIRTHNRDQFYDRLTMLVAEQELPVEEISAPDDNLQAVFDYIIGR